MTAILEAKDLTKTFGHGKHTVEAVKRVSFSLQEREIVTIVGESGSGKSTLGRMLLGLLPITSGTLHFRGKDVTHMKGADRTAYWREVQAVFQDPFSSFNQFFTVRRLLNRSMRLLESKVGQERLEESLNHVGLTGPDVLDRYPHQLSGGQRQRIMIARALMLQPRLLLADEAT